MKRGPYKSSAAKRWSSCIAKTHLYKTLEIGYWDQYQLLGYWCDMTKMLFNQEACDSYDHPQVVKMRLIIQATCFENRISRGSKDIPAIYDATPAKEFLDWVWETMKTMNKPCHSLTYITGQDKDGEDFKWFDNWRSDRMVAPKRVTAEFDASKLDIDIIEEWKP